MLVQIEFGKHANLKSGQIFIHIGKPTLAVFRDKAIVAEFYVLHLHTEKESVMQPSLIDVRIVLQLSGLRECSTDSDSQQQYDRNEPFQFTEHIL